MHTEAAKEDNGEKTANRNIDFARWIRCRYREQENTEIITKENLYTLV